MEMTTVDKSRKIQFHVNWGDLLVLLIISIIVCSFLSPMLFGWLGIFWDDFTEVFPRLYSTARSVQQGAIPLWNPGVFAGGRINFIPYTPIWYWSIYPFYWLADLFSPSSAYLSLIKLPILCFWLISALSAYGLGRRLIKINQTGAMVLALVFTFGVAGMTGNSGGPMRLYAAAWMPLAIWGLIDFSKRGNWLMGLSGALAICFLTPTFNAIIGLFNLTTVIICWFLMGTIRALRNAGRGGLNYIFRGSLIIGLGLLLSGPFWASLVAGRACYQGWDVLQWQMNVTSMPWSYLSTLAVPDLLGSMTNNHLVDYRAIIGLPNPLFHVEANLTGGFWLLLLCILGSVCGFRRRINNPEGSVQKEWWITGIALFLFSILLITGRCSPVYRVLTRYLPVFGLPYPIRWRILEHLGIALVAGVSAHWLSTSRRKLPIWGLLLVLLLSISVVIWQWGRHIAPNSITILNYFWANYRNWFLHGPVNYLILMVAGTVLLIVISRRVLACCMIIGAAVIEVLLIGFLTFYFLAYPNEETRYLLPEDTGYYRCTQFSQLANLPPPRTGPERTVFCSGALDEMATLHGGDYLFGLNAKPVAPRMTEVLKAETRIWPYAVEPRDCNSRYYPNMSVRHLVLDEPEEDTGIQAQDVQPLPGTEDTGLYGLLYDYRLRDTLPRVFSQDRIVLCSPEEAMNELLNGDLRRGAFLEGDKRLAVSSKRWTEGKGTIISYHEFMDAGREEESAEHFKELQKLNQINRVWFPSSNRMNIDIDVKAPSLLITTDVYYPGWEVKVDGGEKTPLQINYLQRGVWLDEGNHLVEWVFSPPEVKWGFVGVGIGLIGLVCLMVRSRRSRVRIKVNIR